MLGYVDVSLLATFSLPWCSASSSAPRSTSIFRIIVPNFAASINLIAMLFLRLIKMIIAPLVFATLVGGIAHMGSGSKLGRIFAKTMGWFISASFVSLLLGLVMVNLLQPGANFPGTLPAATQSTGLPVSAFSLEKFLTPPFRPRSRMRWRRTRSCRS